MRSEVSRQFLKARSLQRAEHILGKSVRLNKETHSFILRDTIVFTDSGPLYDRPVDVVVFMEMQQTGGDLKSHSLKSQEVPGRQVRGHPICLALGSQIPLQVTLFVHCSSNTSSELHADLKSKMG